eukprot:gnl/TRDRNA2_/TRDRNA2_161224_c0_seq1.p1 gnl/TRDRNA2_/TRDRNA2_161224_c0~~gnl/TRDRNA2_/TRDRNA2_161224_c0_seq1.p1  ORF type:complete len:256 (+),score=30.57 gnl/TRDRNA2_/TRDRNA2_161224_c0_seq1:118-885(+)
MWERKLKVAVFVACGTAVGVFLRFVSNALDSRAPAASVMLGLVDAPGPAAVLWLHGFSDTGDKWAPLASAFEAKMRGVKWFYPDAPTMTLSFNGETTTSWFDIVTRFREPPPSGKKIGLDEPDNPNGLMKAVAIIHRKLEEIEKEGVPSERIVLGGFSQGGTVSILAGLTYPKKLGGVVSSSGWATYRDSLERKLHTANAELPILFSYGTRDIAIDDSLSKRSIKVLRAILGDSVKDLEIDRDEHSPSTEEMLQI